MHKALQNRSIRNLQSRIRRKTLHARNFYNTCDVRPFDCRLFQDIDMPKLCDYIREESETMLVQAAIPVWNEYDVVDTKYLAGQTKTFRARGCNLSRIGNLGGQLFITAPKKNPRLNPKNERLVVLFCFNTNECHYSYSIVLEDFERKYPILGKTSCENRYQPLRKCFQFSNKLFASSVQTLIDLSICFSFTSILFFAVEFQTETTNYQNIVVDLVSNLNTDHK